MKIQEALIAWTPAYRTDDVTAGQVRVGPLLSEGDRDWTDPYAYTGGAAYTEVRKASEDDAVLRLFIEFNTLTVRDGLDPKAVHEAFLAIDQYRRTISRDTPGAED